MLGSLFGGSSSSKKEENKQQSAGFSEIGGGVNSLQLDSVGTGKYAQNDFSITSTDYGSVKAAFSSIDQVTKQMKDVAYKAINEVGDSQRNALNFGETSLTKVLDFARSTNSEAKRQVMQSNENFTNKFSEFANRQSNSNDQRMTDVAKWAIGGAVALTAFSLWQRRKAA